MTDDNWPEICDLVTCSDPYLRPHHHHYSDRYIGQGILNAIACQCGNVDQPGTKPKE